MLTQTSPTSADLGQSFSAAEANSRVASIAHQKASLIKSGWREDSDRWYEPGAPRDPGRHTGWSLKEALEIQCRITARSC